MSFSIMMIILVAACSSSDESSETSGESNEKGEFTFASSGLYPPFNYTENDELVGFDVEIGKAIAEELGMNPKPVTNPWQTIIAALNSDKFDAIIGSMAITAERLEEVNFTEPYYESGAQIFVSEDNDSIKVPEDLKDKK